MKVDFGLTADLAAVADQAQALERIGFDGLFSFEGPHDPFFPLLLAAEHTERPELYTSIAVAFARNPMILANVGWDLNAASGGRFILGLGSQIKPHIEKRFSMPWSRPAARMREMVLAIRAIWTAWQEGTRLRFKGDFYTHTLMTPFFDPGPSPYGLARIWVAGVGPAMTETAGEVADGLLVHPFSTPRYLRETTLPAVARGLEKSGRSPADFEVSWPAFIVTGTTSEQMDQSASATRRQLAFYGSTPAYKPVLDAHGWGDLQGELNTLSKRGEWDQMGTLISDEMLETFAVRAEPEDLGRACAQRFGDLVDRISLDIDWETDADRWAAVIADFAERR